MPPADTIHYLHPDFDPWTIKMDQIREILIQHHVKPPTGSVRKQQLVDLFNEHIRPQVPELSDSERAIDADVDQAEHASTSRTRQRQTKGAVETEAEAEQSPNKPKVKRSNSRVSTKAAKKDVEPKDSESPRGRRPRKSGLLSEDDSEPSPSKPRRVKRESSGGVRARSKNFSDENPFQSGGESDRGRGRSKARDGPGYRTRSRSRQSTQRIARDNHTTTVRDRISKAPQQPAFSEFMHTPPPPAVTAEPKSSQSTSAASRTRKLSVSDLPPPKPLHLSSTLSDTRDFKEILRRNMVSIGVVVGAILMAYGVWYRQTRFDIGFCTENEPSSSGGWLYPSCIPCPDYATCLSPHEDPICPPEYLLKPQLLSFGNMLPLTPVCVLNKAKEYQSLQVADAAEKLVHIHAGNVECSILGTPTAKDSVEYRARRGISTNELRSQLEQLKDASVSEEDFSHYWDRALRELRQRTDKVIFELGLAGEERIRSLRPRKSLSCRFRQALVGWIIKFRPFLFVLIMSIVGGLGIRAYITRRRRDAKTISGLVQNVLTKLSDQAHYHYIDPVVYSEPFLPQTHLRDALLLNIHTAARRQAIWDKVQDIVERNSNVRTSSQEVRGELHKVWEWVGTSGVLSQQAAVRGNTAASEDNRMLGGAGLMRGTLKAPPRMGPHGSFFGMRRQDSEYMNPENPLYPSLSQDYTFSQE
ncbi:inner nuclear membrane protein enriched at telomere/subtelomere region [Haplosporangium sp. Z 11]|nr:inner nuclear membrane protein enriched at telomere/subtelomere region [Haplosporangium sp. Z 11]